MWGRHQSFSHSDLISELSKNCFSAGGRHRFLLSSDPAGAHLGEGGPESTQPQLALPCNPLACALSVVTACHGGTASAREANRTRTRLFPSPEEPSHTHVDVDVVSVSESWTDVTPEPTDDEQEGAMRFDAPDTKESLDDDDAHISGQPRKIVQEETEHTAEDTDCNSTSFESPLWIANMRLTRTSSRFDLSDKEAEAEPASWSPPATSKTGTLNSGQNGLTINTKTPTTISPPKILDPVPHSA